jgi:hypothetical protein
VFWKKGPRKAPSAAEKWLKTIEHEGFYSEYWITFILYVWATKSFHFESNIIHGTPSVEPPDNTQMSLYKKLPLVMIHSPRTMMQIINYLLPSSVLDNICNLNWLIPHIITFTATKIWNGSNLYFCAVWGKAVTHPHQIYENSIFISNNHHKKRQWNTNKFIVCGHTIWGTVNESDLVSTFASNNIKMLNHSSDWINVSFQVKFSFF